MFKGSALTFGGVAYHGDAPFQRYTLNEENTGPDLLSASRGSNSGHHPARPGSHGGLPGVLHRGPDPDREIPHRSLVPARS